MTACSIALRLFKFSQFMYYVIMYMVSRLSYQGFRITKVNLKDKGILLDYSRHKTLSKVKQHWATLRSQPFLPHALGSQTPFLKNASLCFIPILSLLFTQMCAFIHPTPSSIHPNLLLLFIPIPFSCIPFLCHSSQSIPLLPHSPFHLRNPSSYLPQVLTHSHLLSSSPIPISSRYAS